MEQLKRELEAEAPNGADAARSTRGELPGFLQGQSVVTRPAAPWRHGLAQ
jgi:hypothetical protein